MKGIITTKNGEEEATIVYKRKADYSKDPYERPLSPYITELFERSDKAIEKLKGGNRNEC